MYNLKARKLFFKGDICKIFYLKLKTDCREKNGFDIILNASMHCVADIFTEVSMLIN